ncbi:MAG TPA: SOS response-associated peptidase [Peptococcaceae bacterium]|nr:SOS response-associated peptidase [Peptococcaceae bacterium]
MCGRFVLTLTIQEVAEILNVIGEIDWTPKYNIAPKQEIPAVASDGQNRLELFQWGLIPYWANKQTNWSGMINARAETIDIKPSFKHWLSRQRCLIPANGFYEWKKVGRSKIPYFFKLNNRKLFCFAGIWDAWKSPEGKIFKTCAIITTVANEIMSPIHNRMPVILEQEQEGIWLNPSMTDFLELKSLLNPYPAELMNAYQVSTYVNSIYNDTSKCIEPVMEQQNLLF